MSIPPVISRCEDVVSSMVLHRSLVEMGRHATTGRADSTVTRRGQSPIRSRSVRPGTSTTIHQDRAAPPSSLRKRVLVTVGLRWRSSVSAGLLADYLRTAGSRRDPSGEGGVEQSPGDLLGLLSRRGPDRLRLVTVLVASASWAVELSRRPFLGRLVEDGTQIAAERLVLAGPVGRPDAVRRQQCLARVVTGVVGNAVLDDGTGEQRKLVQAVWRGPCPMPRRSPTN